MLIIFELESSTSLLKYKFSGMQLLLPQNVMTFPAQDFLLLSSTYSNYIFILFNSTSMKPNVCHLVRKTFFLMMFLWNFIQNQLHGDIIFQVELFILKYIMIYLTSVFFQDCWLPVQESLAVIASFVRYQHWLAVFVAKYCINSSDVIEK